MSLSLSLSLFFGHVMSSHHSEQMSQRSQVSRMALRRCSQNVFVFVFVNFFGHVMFSHHSEQMFQWSQVSRMAHRRGSQNVFVFVIVFVNLVMSCLLITLIKCLKGHKSLGSLFNCLMFQNQKVTQSV